MSGSLLRSTRILLKSPIHPRPTSTFTRQFHASFCKMADTKVHHLKGKEEFDSALKSNNIVILDCFAEWCGPCKAIAPLIAKMSVAPENEKVYFAKIDVDESPEVAQELGIRAMPTFMVFKKGEKDHELVGANPPVLQQLVQKYSEEAKVLSEK